MADINSIAGFAINEKFMLGVQGVALKIAMVIFLVVLGILAGKLVKFALRKILEKIKLHHIIRPQFLEVFLVIIKWSIYIVFFNLALNQLDLPYLTSFISKVVLVIPAITGALILFIVGLSLAIFLRNVIKDSEINGWDTLSLGIFHLIVYVFGIYSVKIALISLDTFIVNIILIVLTAAYSVSLAYIISKKYAPIK